MTGKENQRIALTKRLLREGLLTLLEHQSIDKISVTELCRVSGINRSTFYNHYTSPQDVLVDLENTVVAELSAITTRHMPGDTEAAIDCIEEICHYLQNHRQIATTLITFNADTDLVYVFQRLDAVFLHPTTRKGWEKDPDALHLASSFVCTGSYYMIREWLLRDIPKTPREIAELAYYFVANVKGGVAKC